MVRLRYVLPEVNKPQMLYTESRTGPIYWVLWLGKSLNPFASNYTWSDVTVIYGHTTISVLRGNTSSYCVKLTVEDLSRYSNKIESVG